MRRKIKEYSVSLTLVATFVALAGVTAFILFTTEVTIAGV